MDTILKRFEEPDEVRVFEKGKFELVADTLRLPEPRRAGWRQSGTIDRSGAQSNRRLALASGPQRR